MKYRDSFAVVVIGMLGALACGGNPQLLPDDGTSDSGNMKDVGGKPRDDGYGGGTNSRDVPGLPSPSADGLFPAVAHSGFDGVHTFQVLFTRQSEAPVTWSIVPADAATLRTSTTGASSGLSRAILTTRKAGTFEVRSDANGSVIKGLLDVKAYTTAQVELGKTRHRDASGMGTRLACAFCHESAQGVRHAPLALAFFDDASNLSVILTGNYPNGGSNIFGFWRQWELTDSERSGIVPYLRSLPVMVRAP